MKSIRIPCLLITLIVIELLACLSCFAADAKLVKAIHMVETSGRLGPIRGDNGRALGPLQIHRDYWQDSGVAGKYEDCAKLDYSIKVVKAYMQRYAPQAVARKDYDTLARLHNAGPRALKNKKIALDYSKRVRQYIRQ
jgi:hypothetical protein